MRTLTQMLCLVAVLTGGLLLVICLEAPTGHGARELISSLPIIIAGGLIGLAILANDAEQGG